MSQSQLIKIQSTKIHFVIKTVTTPFMKPHIQDYLSVSYRAFKLPKTLLILFKNTKTMKPIIINKKRYLCIQIMLNGLVVQRLYI